MPTISSSPLTVSRSQRGSAPTQPAPSSSTTNPKSTPSDQAEVVMWSSHYFERRQRGPSRSALSSSGRREETSPTHTNPHDHKATRRRQGNARHVRVEVSGRRADAIRHTPACLARDKGTNMPHHPDSRAHHNDRALLIIAETYQVTSLEEKQVLVQFIEHSRRRWSNPQKQWLDVDRLLRKLRSSKNTNTNKTRAERQSTSQRVACASQHDGTPLSRMPELPESAEGSRWTRVALPVQDTSSAPSREEDAMHVLAALCARGALLRDGSQYRTPSRDEQVRVGVGDEDDEDDEDEGEKAEQVCSPADPSPVVSTRAVGNSTPRNAGVRLRTRSARYRLSRACLEAILTAHTDTQRSHASFCSCPCCCAESLFHSTPLPRSDVHERVGRRRGDADVATKWSEKPLGLSAPTSSSALDSVHTTHTSSPASPASAAAAGAMPARSPLADIHAHVVADAVSTEPQLQTLHWLLATYARKKPSRPGLSVMQLWSYLQLPRVKAAQPQQGEVMQNDGVHAHLASPPQPPLRSMFASRKELYVALKRLVDQGLVEVVEASPLPAEAKYALVQ